ncbi:MAG: thioredoxin domain-containing protein [Chloroflexi bacterium]|nr:thioredoxin domain-containing protein [Chloroflexota bacterium]
MADVPALLADARAHLLARRADRPQPARDDKALAAWNGLAIAALADAAMQLASADPDGAARYRDAARRAAETIVGGLLASDGTLARSWKDGRATGNGVLEDHAFLAEGLLALYEATGDERWFAIARSLADRMLDHFADPAGGFFDTGDDHERLVTRPKDLQDNAIPSGNATAVAVLLRLEAWTGEGRYRAAATAALRLVVPFVVRYPTGFAQWLSAMDQALAPVIEIAIVGAPDDPATAGLVAETRRGYRPNQVVSVSPDPGASVVPLLADRVAVGGRATAYVCRSFTCRLPVGDPDALRARLHEAVGPVAGMVGPTG